MKTQPSYRDGHLVVAAIRVLEHLHGRPPTEPDLAELLQWHEDRVRLLCGQLQNAGILAQIRSPHDVRFQIQDHAKLEELSREEEDLGQTFAEEMAAHEARAREEYERLERLFRSGERKEKPQKKPSSLEEDFGNFKRDKPLNPFGED